MIYEQTLITIGRSLHDKRCFAFIAGYSPLSHAPWGPISIWFIGRVLITYHCPHTYLGLGWYCMHLNDRNYIKYDSMCIRMG